MEIAELINHPEKMDRDTLYELRSKLALYPYFQTARLLLLQNLYLLHDSSFDEELRRAAIYITNRRVLFKMIEAGHYQIKNIKQDNLRQQSPMEERDSRTFSLIDDFLDSLPKNEDSASEKTKRRPTPADAAVDYMAYLIQSDADFANDDDDSTPAPQLKGHDLIDTFIENDKGKIILNESPTLKPELENETEEEYEPENNVSDAENTDHNNSEENEAIDEVYTETLSRIYIKQGNYSKALEILRHLNLAYPKKNAYFADQIRFLEKLIINSNKKIK